MTDGRRVRAAWIIRQVLARSLLPHHVAGWMRRRRQHRRVPTAERNLQLGFYSRVLAGDHLHYGYFDDVETAPERLGLHDISHAQWRYAEELVKLIDRPGEPVLDAGSGMGGLLALLRERGFKATGLTPDAYQVYHIRRAQPGVPVLHCRFEDMPADGHDGAFGTVIHAESIQYMDPDRVFAVVERVLAPGGLWIVADYFRVSAEGERSGWLWEDFRKRIDAGGFRVEHSRDITAHVLPTLGFAHLLASRIGLPAFEFGAEKLRAKSPAAHYVAEDILAALRGSILRNMALVDPAEFARRKRYMLVCLRRA